jgi:hypothetical protein
MNARSEDIAVDKSPDQRPGVPHEHPPRPAGNAHWDKPPAQVPDTTVLKDVEHEHLTATFGTAAPPHGLSGALRRAAYRIPDYYIRHWLLLVVADRVDVVESRAAKLFRRPLTWVAASVGVTSWMIARRRR